MKKKHKPISEHLFTQIRSRLFSPKYDVSVKVITAWGSAPVDHLYYLECRLVETMREEYEET